jgi:hypothetical protein
MPPETIGGRLLKLVRPDHPEPDRQHGTERRH